MTKLVASASGIGCTVFIAFSCRIREPPVIIESSADIRTADITPR